LKNFEIPPIGDRLYETALRALTPFFKDAGKLLLKNVTQLLRPETSVPDQG